MASHAYTAFPNLHAAPVTEANIYSVDIIITRIQLETLQYAWAEVLHKYTALDTIRFAVNDHDILASKLESWRLIQHQPLQKNVTELTGITTGIDITRGGVRPSVFLAVDPTEGLLKLHASTCIIPFNHLSQLALQLKIALGLKSKVEKVQVSASNTNPQLITGPRLLHDLVSRHFGSNKPALLHMTRDGKKCSMSYTELDQLSSRLAQMIRSKARTTSRTTVIPVIIPQSIELYVALVAVLRAGAAFCPIGLDAPPERIRFVAADVSAGLIVTVPEFSNLVPNIMGIPTISVSLNDLRKSSDSLQPGGEPECGSPCYVMYTSGSTGQPKGVVLPHQAVTQSLLAHDPYIPSFERFLQMASPTFDVSMFEIFFTLYRGSTVVSCDRERLLSGLPKAINELGVDAAELTPTVATTLLRTRDACPGLKSLLTIGEMLTQHVVSEFGGTQDRQSMLYAMYGPTEAAIHCTMQGSLSASSKLGNIGRPLPTVSTYVGSIDVQDDLEVLPIGQVGELVVGGHQIAAGYLNRPKETRTVFVMDSKHGSLYRTGDQCRMLPDGSLEILGRIAGSQTKLRGQRIELGEIEQTIMSKCSFHSVVALVINNNLVVFCARETNSTSREGVLDTCKDWLPGFMVPSDVVLLDSMPRLSSGKIDKKALEIYSLSSEEGPLSHVDGETERGLLKIIRQSLGKINATTRFTSAGVDSLNAIRLASTLRDAGFRCSAADIISSKTPRLLIQKLHNARPAQDLEMSRQYDDLRNKLEHEIILDQTGAKVVPCTPLQNSMLVETRLNKQAYWNEISLSVSCRVPVARLKEALLQLCHHHEMLRSEFVECDHPQSPYARIITTNFSESRFVDDLETSEDRLSRPLLFAIKVSHISTEVSIRLHHALYDGWSFDLLMSQLNTLLSGGTLPASIPFDETACYLWSHARSPSDSLSHTFWKDYLIQAEPLIIPPLTSVRPEVYETLVVSSNMGFSTSSLISKASSLQCHPQVLFQAALAVLLRYITTSNDVIFGTVSSGRAVPVANVDKVVGPCISTLPLRVKPEPDAPIRRIIDSIQKSNQEMLAHTALPLHVIKSLAGVSPGHPLFETLFVWQESLFNTTHPLIKVVSSRDYIEQKLLIEIEPTSEFIKARATFHSDFLTEKMAVGLLEQLEELVVTILHKEDMLVKDFVDSLSLTRMSLYNHPPERLEFSHGLAGEVVAMARSDPERLAVELLNESHQTTSLTYSELNQKANVMAHKLLEAGVRQGDAVCIHLPKSLEFYVSVLAVIKAGAGYLPITVATPVARVQAIQDLAKVQTCISSPSHVEEAMSLVWHNVTTIDPFKVDWQVEVDEYNPDLVDDNLAYLIFTSGTTGKPKGVPITQRNIASNVHVLAEKYPIENDTQQKFLQSTSIAFDVSVFEILFTWTTGMCLSAVPDHLFHMDMEGVIRDLGVTHLSHTPTVAGLIQPENVPKVRFLVIAGEAMTERVHKNWAGKGIWQGYGPSETTNIITVHPKVSKKDAINFIGIPFRNASAFIASLEGDRESLNLIPKGCLGEICFGGDQVFSGYLNSEEDQGKFIRHAEYGNIFRSGDLGRMLDDGSILIHGRVDDQVKLRGQRVELGEVTNRLCAASLVSDATSMVVSKNQLVAFWVPAKSESEEFQVLHPTEVTQKTNENLFEYLPKHLPPYMIPTALVPVSRLPLTPSNKVDKKRLQDAFSQLDIASYGKQSKLLSPNTAYFKAICKAIAETLSLHEDSINIQASFFSYGIDSISAIAVARRLRQMYPDIPFEVSMIMRNASVAALSQALTESRSQSTAREEVDLATYYSPQTLQGLKQKISRPILKILPLTPLQEAMLSSLSGSNDQTYFNRTTFHLRTDLLTMKRAWEVVTKRHDILRAMFAPIHNKNQAFAQIILQDVNIQWRETYATPNPFEGPAWLLVHDQIGAVQRLCLVMHHALYDALALRNLFAEVEALCRGEALPQVVPFENFLSQALAQNDNTNVAFWTDTLKGFEPTKLPNLTGLSKTAREGRTTSHVQKFMLNTPLSHIEDKCKHLQVSMLTVCQLAFAKMLLIYHGERDVCFGNIISGRTLPVENLESLVAPCFNTVPIRLQLSASKTNAQALLDLQKLNADILPHQMTSLRRIQREVLPGGDNLFDTLLILQTEPSELDDQLWAVQEDVGAMEFPMVCELTPNHAANTLSLTLHCHRSYVRDVDIEKVFLTFQQAFMSSIDCPDWSVDQLGSIPESISSSSSLSIGGDGTRSELLQHAFLKQVQAHPDKTALAFLHRDGRTVEWSFADLERHSRAVAQVLVPLDLEREEAIPIHIPKGPLYYASVLGVLRAGAAFTPIDPSLPTQRKALMIGQLNARFILTLESLDWCEAEALVIEEHIQTTTIELPVRQLSVDEIAYRIYTSGSTGTPKAVAVEHRNAVQTIHCSHDVLPWSKDTRLLNFASITFDMCYYDIFLAWSHGFCLCAADQDYMLNELPQVCNSLGVTMLDLTPSMALTVSRDKLPSVEFLYCIGEAMQEQIIKQWQGACVNSYGPTEAAMCITVFPVRTEASPSVIGTPFPSSRFHVLQPDRLDEVPVLGLGELCIEGSQIARGYHNDDQLTAQQFISRSGTRLYRTGDLVRRLGDGNYEHISRIGSQVKIRGLRVELGEINSVLKDDTADAFTMVEKLDDTSKPQLVAFVVPLRASNETTVKSDLLQRLSNRLPAYMVPSSIFVLEKMPRALSGKVDLRTLRSIFRNNAQAAGEEALDEAELNPKLIDIVRQYSTTSPETVKPGSTIFSLGLDSISAVQVAAALRQEGYDCSSSDILRRPKLRDLSVFVSSLKGTSHVKEQPTFDFGGFDKKYRKLVSSTLTTVSSDITAIRPCTPLQAGMLARFENSNGDLYFNYWQFSLPGHVDKQRMRNAWNAAREKNEMLRTGFFRTGEKTDPYVMITYRPRADVLPLEMVEELHIDSMHGQVIEQSLENLERPPWHVYVQGQRLLFSAHHAIFDASSILMIFEDVRRAYAGGQLVEGYPIEPALGTILLGSRSQHKERTTYWQNTIKNGSSGDFPTLTSHEKGSFALETAEHRISMKQSQIDKYCRDQSITLQVLVQVAWSKILQAYTGEDNVMFGMTLSGRTTLEDASKAAFPVITTVPVSVDASQAFRTQFNQLMDFNTSVFEHQFTPLVDIQRAIDKPHTPLFESLIVLQQEWSVEEWRIEEEHGTVELPLSLEVIPSDQPLLRLIFRTNKVAPKQAVLILKQLDQVFQEILGRHAVAPETLSALPPSTPRIEDSIKLLHEFVEASAIKVPTRAAFEFAEDLHGNPGHRKTWSFAQLNEQGNMMANMLIFTGIKQGSIVAVCFDKCPQASFAMLGILKAGCAFLAIDPGAPEARKNFVLQDSGAAALITTSSLAEGFASKTKILTLDSNYLQDIANFPDSSPELSRPVDPSDTSYCLYTSGTTGTPKGCELSHENAVQALLAFRGIFRWTPGSRWLQFASFHFDVSVLEQYWSWAVGICCVSAPRDLIFADIPGTIRDLRITHLDLTPSLARLLDPTEVPTLCTPDSVFITGGEALRQDIIDTWGNIKVIHNGYGPTEATIGCTMYPRVPSNGKPSNIGLQFVNVGTFVLKPDTFDIVMRGSPGELCVYGPLVAKGYLNRAELTAERFPTMPSGERIYRTGDLVRLNHDDSFTFLGRIDGQVKLRGQRLEVGEIDAVIKASHSDVLDVATIVAKHPRQQKDQLVTFIVRAATHKARNIEVLQNTPGLTAAISSACQDHLPPYMVPTHFLTLTKMPLSANNKVDNKALKELYNNINLEQLHENDPEDDHRWSHGQRRIVEAIATFTCQPTTSLHRTTNLFEIGLDSINVLSLSKRLKDVGYPKAVPAIILRNSRLGNLVKSLESGGSKHSKSLIDTKQVLAAFDHRHRAEAAMELKLSLSDIEAVAPCTPLQEGIISRHLSSKKPVYHGHFQFQVGNDVEPERLKIAFTQLMKDTQILRIVFLNSGGRHYQVAIKTGTLAWIELSKEDSLEKAYDLWSQDQLSFSRRPWQVVFHENRVLSLHMFHALYDGNSVRLLLNKLRSLYENTTDSFQGPKFFDVLPHGPLQAVPNAEQFWRRHLQAIGKVSLSSPSPTKEDILLRKTVSSNQNFEACRRKLNVTDQAIMQGCWSAVLQSLSHRYVTFGLVVSGRTIDFEGADDVIGPMFNTLPFGIPIHQNDTWAEIIRRCHEFNIASLQYQHTPLRSIQKWLKNGDLFSSLFVYQQTTEPPKFLKEIETRFKADYDLALEVEKSYDGTLYVSIGLRSGIMSERDAMEIIDLFISTLTKVITNTQAQASSVLDLEVRNEVQAVDVRNNSRKEYLWTTEAKTLRKAISDLSGADETSVTPYVSLLELGLDSIDAVQLSSKLKKSYGLSIPVSAIMKHRTIERMTEYLHTDNAPTSNGSHALENIRSRLKPEDLESAELVLPATSLQEGIVAKILDTNLQTYFNHELLKLDEKCQVEKLRLAWQKVYEASPILRTVFKEVDDPAIGTAFAQVVVQPSELPWMETSRDSQDQIPDLLEDIRSDFLSRGPLHVPLFRLTLAHVERRSLLVLSMSHALYDGYSIGLLHEDLRRAYNDSLVARPSYETFIKRTLDSAHSDETMHFWRGHLHNAPSSNVPDRGLEKLNRAEMISQVSHTTIRDFCKKERSTVGALMQCCWTLSLAALLKSLDVVYGVVLACRDAELEDQIMFPTMNTVAARMLVHGTKAEMVRYVQDTMASISEHQHYPLRKAQSLAGPREDSLFNSLFIFQRRSSTVSNSGYEPYVSTDNSSSVGYPLAVEAEVVGDKIIWRAAATAMSQDETQRFMSELDASLEDIVSHPETPVLSSQGSNVVQISSYPAFAIVQDHQTKETNGYLSDDREEPPSQTEKAIQRALASVAMLDEDDVNRHSTIQNIGLDSISAIKVSSLLRKSGVSLHVSDMLRAKTLQNMAKLVESRVGHPVTSASTSGREALQAYMNSEGINIPELLSVIGYQKEDIQYILPATAGQVYMMSMTQKYGLFFPTFRYLVRGLGDARPVEAAWAKLIAGQSMLRTLVLATGSATTPFIQVVLHRAARHNTPLAQLETQVTGHGVELALTIHHSLYDGVSLAHMLEQMRQYTNSKSSPETASYDVYERFLSHTTAVTEREVFWTAYLKGAKNSRNLSAGRAGAYSWRIESFKRALLPSTTNLKALAQSHGLTIQSVILALYARVYAGRSTPGHANVVIGLYIANRSHAIQGLDSLTSPTVNLVPIRVDVGSSDSIVGAAQKVQEDIAKISENVTTSSVSLAEISRWTGVLIDTFVNFIRLPVGEGQQSGDGWHFEEVRDDNQKDYARRVPLERQPHSLVEHQRQLAARNTVGDAYLPAIDVEIKARGQELDVGIFAPEHLLNLDECKQMMVGLEHSLVSAGTAAGNRE